MKTTARPRNARSLVPVALVALLVTPLVQADHVAGNTMHHDLAISDIIVPALHVDESNEIKVQVRNVGRDVGRGIVVLSGTNPGTTDPNPNLLIGAERVEVAVGDSLSVSFTWNGRDRTNQPAAGAQVLRAEVVPAPKDEKDANNVRTESVFVIRHELLVSFPSALGKTVSPGAKAAYKFTVENLGNADDRARMSVQGGIAGWSYSFAQPEMFLRAGGGSQQPVENTLFVRPSSDAVAGTEDGSSVVATSTASAAATDVAAAPVTIVGQVAGVQLSRASPQAGRPEETITFDMDIRNLGNGQDTFVLTPSPPSDAWDVFLRGTTGSEITVGAGALAAFSVDVRIPTGESVGERLVTLDAASKTNKSAKDTVFLRIQTLQVHGVRVDLDQTSRLTGPSVPAEFDFTATNLGNGEDTLVLHAEGLPSGWTATFSPDRFLLSSCKGGGACDGKGVLRVTPRAGQPVGQTSLEAVVEADADSTVRDAQPLSVQVKAGNGVNVSAQTQTRGVSEGETVEYSVVLQNAGNQDDEIEFDLQVAASSPPAAQWSYEPKEGSVRLAGGATHTLKVRVTGPSAALTRGDQHELRVDVKSTKDPTQTDDLVLVTTAKLPDLVVESLSLTPSPAYRGENITLKAVILNRGERAAIQTFDVSATRQSLTGGTGGVVPAATAKTLTSLAVGERRDVFFEIPTAGLTAGTYRFAVHADKNERVAETNDEAAGSQNNLRSTDATLNVFALRATAPAGVETDTGTTVRFANGSAFRLRNDGDKTESVTVTPSVSSGWDVFAEPSVFTIAPGQEQRVDVSVQVPNRVANEPHGILRVRFELPGRTQLSAVATTTVDLKDEEAPRILSQSLVAGAGSVGLPVRFYANVTDNLGLSQVLARITAPDGKETLLPMVPTRGEEYTTVSAFGSPGRYSYQVQALDFAGNPATNDTMAEQFELEPTGSVVFRPLDWTDGARVRGDGRLQVVVDASSEVVEAYYRLDGSKHFFTDSNPYTIQLAGVKEGARVVVVTFVTATGASTEGNFTLNVDNTAPAIDSVVANPSRAAVGDSVRITVRTLATDVAKATIILSTATGPATRVAAVETAGGEFVAQFAMPAGLLAVRVELEDNVGNVASSAPPVLQGIFAASVPHKSPTVGVALLVVLVAVAAARSRWWN